MKWVFGLLKEKKDCQGLKIEHEVHYSRHLSL